LTALIPWLIEEDKMELHFSRVALSDIQVMVQQHLVAIPSAVDSFYEDHILESAHYRILVGKEMAGFASIHEESMITQFSLASPYKHYGQAIYQRLRKMEEVRAAFVPTCDEFFLSHALDDYRELAKQAYFFAVGDNAVDQNVMNTYSLRQAGQGDVSFIRENSGDFFDKLEEDVKAGEIFMTLKGDDCVGFGVIVKSKFYDDVASIGMYTIERFRRAGIGAATIKLLIQKCRKSNLRAVAGCWYYNHLSKKTLERAGMYTQTRLLKIEY
jgi:predicted acetyltransferase